MHLRLRGVDVTIGDRAIVSGVDLHADDGEFVALVGPNGSGKTTLLRTVYRALRPSAGEVLVDGDDVWALPAREAARRVAAVVQEPPLEFELSARDMVLLGRLPHRRDLERDRAADHAAVDAALSRVAMGGRAEQPYATLSGGEKQRVLIALALAQSSRLLVLDEPTNHLDVRYQLEVLRLVGELPVTCLVALHDLNLAATFADRVCVLDAGRVAATGPPADVLTPTLVKRVFGVEVSRWEQPRTGRLRLAFDLPEEGADGDHGVDGDPAVDGARAGAGQGPGETAGRRGR